MLSRGGGLWRQRLFWESLSCWYLHCCDYFTLLLTTQQASAAMSFFFFLLVVCDVIIKRSLSQLYANTLFKGVWHCYEIQLNPDTWASSLWNIRIWHIWDPSVVLWRFHNASYLLNWQWCCCTCSTSASFFFFCCCFGKLGSQRCPLK